MIVGDGGQTYEIARKIPQTRLRLWRLWQRETVGDPGQIWRPELYDNHKLQQCKTIQLTNIWDRSRRAPASNTSCLRIVFLRPAVIYPSALDERARTDGAAGVRGATRKRKEVDNCDLAMQCIQGLLEYMRPPDAEIRAKLPQGRVACYITTCAVNFTNLR